MMRTTAYGISCTTSIQSSRLELRHAESGTFALVVNVVLDEGDGALSKPRSAGVTTAVAGHLLALVVIEAAPLAAECEIARACARLWKATHM